MWTLPTSVRCALACHSSSCRVALRLVLLLWSSGTDPVVEPQVGFLYLRYVGNPRNLWEWVQPYVRDTEVET